MGENEGVEKRGVGLRREVKLEEGTCVFVVPELRYGI